MIGTLRTASVACAAAAIVMMATPGAEAAASLSEAKELYAAAAYGDALAMLDGMMQARQTREDRQTVELYRVLCLVALGRRADADTAVEAMIQRDPFYRPTSDEISPRMRAAFADARQRLLPSVVQQDYSGAKGAFDRKDFGTAASAFAHVLKVLAQPDLAAAVSKPPLSDLKTLAEGFRDLSAKAMAPAPSARPVAAEVPAPGRVYTAGDRLVVPPTTIKQRVPPFRGKATGPGEGVIEVVIASSGAVESARMTVPLHPQYDRQVISAAKEWQYKPATVNGVPVTFRKQVKINVVLPE